MKRPVIVLVAALALLTIAVPAEAAGATVVRGHQSSPVASCMGESSPYGTYKMTGALVGCWYIDAMNFDRFNDKGSAAISGTETFLGCLDRDGDGACTAADSSGTFHTTFTFTTKFDPATFAEIHGRCHHPIVGGTGDFTGISGVINFHDIVTATEVSARYYGPIRL